MKSPKDLEGKTIAVNTLNNICGVTINATLEEKGVDVSKLKYTEIPFPEMVAALEKGRVDGACVVEPFVSPGDGRGHEGHRSLLRRHGAEPDRGHLLRLEGADRLQARGRRSLRDGDGEIARVRQQNPDAVRAVLPEYTKIPKDAAQKINLPSWDAELHEDTIQRLSELSQKYGYIEKQPDLDDLIRR